MAKARTNLPDEEEIDKSQQAQDDSLTLNIPYADEEEEETTDDEEEEDDEDEVEEEAPKPKSKKELPVKKSKAKIVEEEEEDEEEDTEEEEDDDDDEDDEQEELSVHNQIALDLIDDDVLLPLPDKEYKDGALGLAELVEDTVEQRLKTRIPEQYQSILEAIELGVDPADWAANQIEVDFGDADLDDEGTQEYLVRKALELQGLDKERIDKKIARYKKDDTLQEEAEEAQPILIKNEQKRKKEYNDSLVSTARERQAKQKEIVDGLRKKISATKEIAGFFVNKDTQKQLEDYMIKPVTPKGETQYMLDRNNPDKSIVAAFLTMKGIDADKLDRVKNSTKTKGYKDSLKAKTERETSAKGRTPKEHIDKNAIISPWGRTSFEVEDN